MFIVSFNSHNNKHIGAWQIFASMALRARPRVNIQHALDTMRNIVILSENVRRNVWLKKSLHHFSWQRNLIHKNNLQSFYKKGKISSNTKEAHKSRMIWLIIPIFSARSCFLCMASVCCLKSDTNYFILFSFIYLQTKLFFFYTVKIRRILIWH